MDLKRLTPEQASLKELILKKSFTEFGSLEEVPLNPGPVYSPGHPICNPPVGTCAPGNYVPGPPVVCGGETTYLWCAS